MTGEWLLQETFLLGCSPNFRIFVGIFLLSNNVRVSLFGRDFSLHLPAVSVSSINRPFNR
jgi:hypothetical protein